MGIWKDGNYLTQHGDLPDWTSTHQRLQEAIPSDPETRLVPQGYSYYYYVGENHRHYKHGNPAFEEECRRLNQAAGQNLWKTGTYPNGHILERVDKAGKKQGVIDHLELLRKEFGAVDLDELFAKHVGAVICADDSPGAIPMQEYVKSLPNGYSYLVSRDGTVPPDVPDYVNEVVEDAAAMVARLRAMAHYQPA
jgi:hypothetical protein